MATGARPGGSEKFKRWTSNLSPALYEAKIDLEYSKSVVLSEQDECLFYSPAQQERLAVAVDELDARRKTYNQLVEQEAKANGVSPSEVMRYMDEAYEAALEDHQQPDIDVAVLANAR